MVQACGGTTDFRFAADPQIELSWLSVVVRLAALLILGATVSVSWTQLRATPHAARAQEPTNRDGIPLHDRSDLTTMVVCRILDCGVAACHLDKQPRISEFPPVHDAFAGRFAVGPVAQRFLQFDGSCRTGNCSERERALATRHEVGRNCWLSCWRQFAGKPHRFG